MITKKTILFLLFTMFFGFVFSFSSLAVGLGQSCQTDSDCDSGMYCNEKFKECGGYVSTKEEPKSKAKSIQFTPSVPIPGFSGVQEIKGDFSTLTEYISAFYKFMIGLAGILSVIMLTIAGLMWLTAGGNASQIGKAKQWIGGSLTGLVLALLSYTILYTINPDIVELEMRSNINQIAGQAEGCKWQMDSCKSFQRKGNDIDCGQKPKLNNQDDPAYKYCCCTKPKEYSFCWPEGSACSSLRIASKEHAPCCSGKCEGVIGFEKCVGEDLPQWTDPCKKGTGFGGNCFTEFDQAGYCYGKDGCLLCKGWWEPCEHDYQCCGPDSGGKCVDTKLIGTNYRCDKK